MSRGQDERVKSEEADAASLTHTDSFDHTHQTSMQVDPAWNTTNSLVFAHVHGAHVGVAAAHLVKHISDQIWTMLRKSSNQMWPNQPNIV